MVLLHFHDRQCEGAEVPKEDAVALVKCFGTNARPDAEASARATEFLTALRRCDEWLACDCRDDFTLASPPLMAPRLRAGDIHIWRFGETPHAKECPFYVEPETRSPADDQDASKPQGWQGDWLLLREPHRRPMPAPRRKTPAAGSAAAPPRPLARLLATALTECGYTIVAPGDTVTRKGSTAISRRHDAYAGLQSLGDKPLTEGVTWREVGCSFLPALPAHLRKLKDIEFPRGVRPQGLFLGVVDEILEEKGGANLVWRGGKDNRVALTHVEDRMVFAQGTDQARGPFWIMAQLAQNASGEFVVVSATAQPCLSRSVLLPVGGKTERELAEILLNQINYWALERAQNKVVQLEKPLFPETVTDGTEVTASFVLWMPGGKRVIVLDAGAPRELRAGWQHRPGVVAVMQREPGAEPFAFARKLTAVVAATD